MYASCNSEQALVAPKSFIVCVRWPNTGGDEVSTKSIIVKRGFLRFAKCTLLKANIWPILGNKRVLYMLSMNHNQLYFAFIHGRLFPHFNFIKGKYMTSGELSFYVSLKWWFYRALKQYQTVTTRLIFMIVLLKLICAKDSESYFVYHFVSWEPERRYHYSKMFRWEPEWRYHQNK